MRFSAPFSRRAPHCPSILPNEVSLTTVKLWSSSLQQNYIHRVRSFVLRLAELCVPELW
jgi:hypothetical protein